ncbi:hypothetical protein FKR81_01960 [Lentzea tibetensis]|uniref:Uncharacterized protein n=1 Tax=Lentzea tibetensis TaxID=2591470 RepID=A0A563F2Z3_9PSEU|nr:hypothetical protein FKR81_01960 [Lentzea tibetensis]
MTDSAAYSTSTTTPPDLHGRSFRHLQCQQVGARSGCARRPKPWRSPGTSRSSHTAALGSAGGRLRCRPGRQRPPARCGNTTSLSLTSHTNPHDHRPSHGHGSRARTEFHEQNHCLDDVDPYRGLYEPVTPQRLDRTEIGEWRRLLDEAWRLLAGALPDFARAVSAGMDSLVPKPRVQFRNPSASTGEAFGSAIVGCPT